MKLSPAPFLLLALVAIIRNRSACPSGYTPFGAPVVARG